MSLNFQRSPVAVVVDAYSSGALLAPEIRKLGYAPVHLKSTDNVATGIKRSLRPQDFDLMLEASNGLDSLAQGLQQQLSPVAILPGSDPAVKLTDQLAARLALPGNPPSTSAERRDKQEMWDHLRKLHPDYVAYSAKAYSIEEAVQKVTEYGRWPVVVKLPHASGTTGARTCHDMAEVREHVQGTLNVSLGGHLPSDHVLIQEYIDGNEYAVNAVSRDGRHIVTAVWEYYRPAIQGACTFAAHDLFMDPSDAVAVRLIDAARVMLNAFELSIGPSHLELKITQDGRIRLMELNSRLAGHFPRIERQVGSFDPLAMTAQAYLRPDLLPQTDVYERLRHGICACLSIPREGMLAPDGLEEKIRKLYGVKNVVVYFRPGSALPRTIDSNTHLADVDLIGDDEAQLLQTLQTIENWHTTLVNNP